MLVLLLALDQFSAPFHAHEHDSGAAVAHDVEATYDTLHGEERHAEDAEHPHISHALVAVRTASPVPAAKDTALVPAVTLLAAYLLLVPLEEQPRPYLRPDPSGPNIQLHRSLPPAGRAPPLRA